MNPAVSIGLTFYNNVDTLTDALRSIFAQSFQDWELIVVDDNSTDGSYERVKSVKDPRVRVFREKEKKCFIAALNQMTQLSKGRYYARMDADDMMHPERLSKQFEYLKTHPEIDVVDTLMCSMDQEGRAIGVRDTSVINVRPATLLSGRFFHHSTGNRIWGPNGSSTSIPNEMTLYNTEKGYIGNNEVSMNETWFPSDDNEWYTWHRIFDNSCLLYTSPSPRDS